MWKDISSATAAQAVGRLEDKLPSTINADIQHNIYKRRESRVKGFRVLEVCQIFPSSQALIPYCTSSLVDKHTYIESLPYLKKLDTMATHAAAMLLTIAIMTSTALAQGDFLVDALNLITSPNSSA